MINYTPPPVLRDFIKDYRPGELFYDWIVGPVGSGKTTGIFMKLIVMAKKQAPGPDGIRRTRAVIVRNTMPQLKDTTLSSWNYWFKHGQAGEWKETDKTFILRFGDVECEVLFRPLDRPEDVARVLSLEVTFAIIDEFVEIPKQIVEALSARCGRYPSKVMGGATNWGMWGSSNPSTEDNWWFDHLHNAEIHVQPKEDVDAARAADALLGRSDRNARYFLQPSQALMRMLRMWKIYPAVPPIIQIKPRVSPTHGSNSISKPVGASALPGNPSCPPSSQTCICPRALCSTTRICLLSLALTPG
jgi:hypothetical protein